MPNHNGDDDAPIPRDELEAGLRFLHVMGMQTKLDLERVDALLNSLIAALDRAGVLATDAAGARVDEMARQARARNLQEEHVKVGGAANKYGVQVPDIDCASLMPLCKARCCRLTVHLSFQDLDEGLRWEYPRPYELRRRDVDGYCIYSEPETKRCDIYKRRPAVCRSYDCRNDKRVWIDFEKKIPAPMSESDPPIYKIRLARESQGPEGRGEPDGSQG